jgi:hypothetical protein
MKARSVSHFGGHPPQLKQATRLNPKTTQGNHDWVAVGFQATPGDHKAAHCNPRRLLCGMWVVVATTHMRSCRCSAW